MKKLSLMIVTMLAGLSMAHASLEQVTDKKEIELIKRALYDSLPSESVYCENSRVFYVSTFRSQLNMVTKVYRDSSGQPILTVLMESKISDPKESAWKTYFAFTTDSTGRNIKKVEIKHQYLEKEKIVNLGTIAKPRYGVEPRAWKNATPETCTF